MVNENLKKLKNLFKKLKELEEVSQGRVILFKNTEKTINNLIKNEDKIKRYINWFKRGIERSPSEVRSHLLEFSMAISRKREDIQEIAEFLNGMRLSLLYNPFSITKTNHKRAPLIRYSKEFSYEIIYLATISNMIIINESALGIKLLDKKLEEVKRVSIFEGISFDRVLQKFSQDELLIFDFKNNVCVHVCLKSYSFSVIFLVDEGIVDVGPLYWWINSEIILTSKTQDLLCLDLSKKVFKPITPEYKKDVYKTFYDFYYDSLNYPVNQADPGRLFFTFLDKKKKIAGSLFWLENEEKTVAYSLNNVANVYYFSDFILENGYEIECIDERKKYSVMMNITEKNRLLGITETFFPLGLVIATSLEDKGSLLTLCSLL